MKKIVISIVSIVALFSCNDAEQSKLIIGRWNCVRWVNVATQEVVSKSVSFEFREDKTYTYVNNELVEIGKYAVQGGDLYTTAEGRMEISVAIEKLTKDSLIFNMNRSGADEQMILIRGE